MAFICEHEFDRPSQEDPKYSALEYDLYAKLRMALRKNLELNTFEIYSTKDIYKRVFFHGTLTMMVKKINELEKAENTTVKCGHLCPLLQQQRRRTK